MTSKVHRVRFYNSKPKSINCITVNKSTKNVALAREDASIEIWDVNYAPYLIKFIPGLENGSIEALAWVGDRLLSTGLGGALLEWDLNKLCLKTTVLLTGYAAWCMDVDLANTLVAVGTEQGYVNLYSVENDEIMYKKLFDKQEGRILCCKFDKIGSIIVTGSIDTIRVWNVETGQALSRMSARRRGQETLIWCLAVLSDNTVVAGESHGRLTFWDISTGDQIVSHATHKSDILSIVANEEENSLYCSGVDPVIVNFVKLEDKKTNNGHTTWVKNVQRHIHEHDVRGLALHDELLLSVGVDGYLTLSSYPPKWVMRIPPMLPPPRSSISSQKRLLLLRYSNYLEIWKLGTYATNENGEVLKSKHTGVTSTNEISTKLENDSAVATLNKQNIDKRQGQSLQLTENATKLVSLQTKKNKQIKCCEISPNGQFILYSTDSHIRMMKLEMDDESGTISLSKMSVSGWSEATEGGCDQVAFSPDSTSVVLQSARVGVIATFHVDELAGASLVQTINVGKYLKTSTLLHLQVREMVHSGTTYLVAADTMGAVAVWIKTKNKYEHYVTLPTYHCVPSALNIDEENETIVLVYVDQKIIEYELLSKKVSDAVSRATPPQWWARRGAARGARRGGGLLRLYDETAVWMLDDKISNPEPAKKKKSKVNGDCNLGLRVIPIKYLSDIHWLSGDEALLIEMLPQNIVAQLPPVAQIKVPPYIPAEPVKS